MQTAPRTPTNSRKRKAASETPRSSDLYEGLFGADFALESPSRQGASPVFRVSSMPPSPVASSPRAAPSTPKVRTPASAGDWLNRVASSPQLGSPQRSGGATSDMHNHPSAALLQHEQQAAQFRMPFKRRRMRTQGDDTFHFPSHGHRSPAGRLPNGHIASSLAQNLGLCGESPSRRMLAPSTSRHARFASTSSIPDRQSLDSYIPVRGYDPLPLEAPRSHPRPMRMHPEMEARPLAPPRFVHDVKHGAEGHDVPHARAHEAALTHDGRSVRHGKMPSPEKAWAARTDLRGHRRSMSYSTLETPLPVSHDRSGSITTPPAASPAYPVTPKSLGSSFSYGESLNMSPTPQPRSARRRQDTQALTASLPAKSSRHLRLRSDDFGARSSRPLWAQSPRPPPAPSFVRM